MKECIMTTRRERRRPLDGAVNPNAETASQQAPVSDDDAERRERIAVAAYYKAERRGFQEGGQHDDWLEAEKETDRKEREQAKPSRPQSEGSARPKNAMDIATPDHMVAREPLPAGQPHDPVSGPARAAASKKPERRKTARPR
jgi:hypothetical protein